jgi:hypothetical protein
VRTSALLIPLLAGCSLEIPQPDGWIAPFDGQTAFAAEQDLVLTMRDTALPDDYDLPSLVDVIDLGTGTRVPGQVRFSNAEVRFTPSSGAWRANRAYAWTLYDPYDAPHGPEVTLPVVGTSTFTVDAELELLDATINENVGQVCLLLSQPTEEGLVLTQWIEDESTVVTAADAPAAFVEYPLAEGDLGAGARCFDNDAELAAGDVVRFARADETGETPARLWRLTVSDLTLPQLLASRRGTDLTADQWGAP